MKAISKYKSLIQELRYIFANLEVDRPSLPLLEKEQIKVMHYANRIADQIKGELIGDGKEAEYKGRLKTAFFELGLDPNLFHYYNTPEFDFATIYKDEATDVKACLEEMALWANDMVQDVCSMLDEVCKFVGYTPEPQQRKQERQQKQQKPKQGEQEQQGCQQQHPQNGEVFLPDVLNTQKTKAVFDEAITRGWMQPNGKGGYEWLGLKDYGRGKQQQFVYMIGQMYGYKKSDSGNEGNNIPCKPLEKLFWISGIYSLLIKCWQVSKPQPWREAIDDMIATALQKTTASTSN